MLLAPEPYPRAEVGRSGDEFQEVRDRKFIRLYFLHWPYFGTAYLSILSGCFTEARSDQAPWISIINTNLVFIGPEPNH